MQKKLIFACDYRGVDLKTQLIEQNDFAGYDVEDIGIEDGSSLDYIDISKKLADHLLIEPKALGIIICGSGQGVAMALNRFSHIRAGLTRTNADAINIREKLDANILCLGSKYSSADEACEMIKNFANTSFKSERHYSCVQKLATHQTNHIKDGVNLIVRALIIHENHVLLSTTTPENTNFPPNLFFLPGGHVEYNEPAIVALKREIWEEMNLNITTAEFAGALECSWDRKGFIYHELDIIYNVTIDNLNLSSPPDAMDHKFHKFIWKKLDKIDNLTILPEKLKIIIKNIQNKNHKAQFLSQMRK